MHFIKTTTIVVNFNEKQRDVANFSFVCEMGYLQMS